MYADRIAAGSKRSIRERLDGNLDDDLGRSRPAASAKRQRQSEDKWKHDLYEDGNEPQNSKPKVGPEDLRLKLQKKGSQLAHRVEKESGVRDLREKLSGIMHTRLQKKGSQEAHRGEKESGVRDLREKLSGIMHTQSPNTHLPKAKPVTGSAKLVKGSPPSIEAPVPETKKTSNPTSSGKKSQQKSNLSVDGFLKSLGLEKYLITFKAEEVDMTALAHMTDEDLKILGIPMGPRKKILLALESRA